MFWQVKSCLLTLYCWNKANLLRPEWVNLKTVFLASHCFMITHPCKVEGHQTAWCSKFLNLVYDSSVTLSALKPMAWLYVEHTPPKILTCAISQFHSLQVSDAQPGEAQRSMEAEKLKLPQCKPTPRFICLISWILKCTTIKCQGSLFSLSLFFPLLFLSHSSTHFLHN